MAKRVGILMTHPTQYHTCWFQELATLSDLDIEVFYCLKLNSAQQGVDFGVEFQWDLPLLEGYRNRFLANIAKVQGFNFSGCDTPEIVDIVNSNKFDCWIINGWKVKSDWQAIRACWRSRTPMLVRGDSHLLDERPLHTRVAKRLLLGRWIPRFTRYLTVGKLNEDYYKYYGADPARFFPVRHFVDNERFALQAEQAKAESKILRERWRIPGDAICFLFAGKFISKKRPMDVIRAIERLHVNNPKVHLLMVGDGALRAECETYVSARQLPVAFSGFLNQNEIARAYSVADVLVLPSGFGETWGLVVNEAMACGLPAIVSSKVGCAPDLVQHTCCGLVFKAGEINALVDAMDVYASKPGLASEHGNAARLIVRDFNVRRAAENTRQAVLSL